MINFEITASPTSGKKVELEQSIVSIQENLKKISPLFEIKIRNGDNYQFLFKLETEEEVKQTFESNSFILLSGAIQTLCNLPSVSLNGRKMRLNEISYGTISDTHEYKNLINN